MNCINFTAKEILPALLAREKVQTIRNATDKKTGKLKPPRYSVGEEVKIYWSQRSKSKYFSTDTGNPWIEDVLQMKEGSGNKKMFNKEMGRVTITDVFRVSMQRHFDGGLNRWTINCPDSTWKTKDLIVSITPEENDMRLFELYKRDGFESESIMFNWIHKNYDLDKEKHFWVYRFRWNKDEKAKR